MSESVPLGSGQSAAQVVAGSVVLGGVVQVRDVGGDVTVTLSRPSYQVDGFPAARVWPGVEQARAQPSRLLVARFEVVPFAGRESLLRGLADWLDKPDGLVSVRLVHGVGGQGKTRLAARLARACADEGRTWQVWQARQPLPTAASPSQLSLPATAAGVLVVVDYADRWASTHLQSLLSDLRTMAAQMSEAPPIRVLLLARSAGWWWQGLQHWLDADLDVSAVEVPLPPLGGEVDRQELFLAARDQFATAMGVSDYQGIALPDGLNDRRFDQVLTVHMAALAAVDAHSHGHRVPQDPQRISAYLMKRERAHWQQWHSRSEDPLATPPEVMGRTVWAATLAGPLTHPDATAVLERAGIAALPENASQILTDHQRCYPPTNPATVLEPLYPDRLAEDFLALSIPGNTAPGADTSAVDAWAGTALIRLLEIPTEQFPPPSWARTVLTVLIETAHRWPHVATTQLTPILTARPELMLYAGGTALARLANLPDDYLDVLKAVGATLPSGRHVDLDSGIAALSTRLLRHRLETTTDTAQQPVFLLEHAYRLGNAGQNKDAVEATRQAVTIYSELVKTERDTYLPRLAQSLNNLAVRLATVGQQRGALDISTQALNFLRELTRHNRSSYLPALAMALSNHANRLITMGRRVEASEHSKEALKLYRELAERNRGGYLSDLAMSLVTRGNSLAEVGRHAEAAEHSEEALQLYRELAEHNRDGYLPDLAMSTGNHALRMLALGLKVEAVDLSGHAVALCNELATLDVNAHQVYLATSLTNHATLLGVVGRLVPAVSASTQAVKLYLRLVKQNRDAYLPDLAKCLGTHAVRVGALGHFATAVDISEHAVQLHRELTRLNRDAYTPPLATALNNHALRLAEIGRLTDAVLPSNEALHLRFELIEQNREAYLPDLAASLNNHAVLLMKLRRLIEAIPLIEQAVELREELVEYSRKAYLSEFASSLDNHAALLGQTGRAGEALQLSEHAIELRKELVQYNREIYLPDLATSLRHHALRFAEARRWDESVASFEQALRLYHELAERDQAVHLPNLGISHTQHAVLLVRAGRVTDALLAAERGARLFRGLVEGNRVTHLPAYIQALMVQGQTLFLAHRYGESIRLLIEDLIKGCDLPRRAPEIISPITSLLRSMHQESPDEVDAAAKASSGTHLIELIDQLRVAES